MSFQFFHLTTLGYPIFATGSLRSICQIDNKKKKKKLSNLYSHRGPTSIVPWMLDLHGRGRSWRSNLYDHGRGGPTSITTKLDIFHATMDVKPPPWLSMVMEVG
jgi:hypothetical protein